MSIPSHSMCLTVWNDLPPFLILQLANKGLEHRVFLLLPGVTPAPSQDTG